MPARNEGSGKEYAAAYRGFLEQVAFPASALRSTYDAPYSRHFFSDEERARFEQRWGKNSASET